MEKINKITRRSAYKLGFPFKSLLINFDINFYNKGGERNLNSSILKINEKTFPKLPRELDGDWETNDYEFCEGLEQKPYFKHDIREFNRVVEVDKNVWVKVNGNTTMKKFEDLVSKDKVSGFEDSARKYIENRKWMDTSFDIALLITARVNELGWDIPTLIEKSTLPTDKIIEILSGRADLTLSEITKLEGVLNIKTIEIKKL